LPAASELDVRSAGLIGLLGQGSWVTARTTLDTTQLLALRFHVPSASGVVRPFDFCVEELAAIVRDP
jgi:hypothetical protein